MIVRRALLAAVVAVAACVALGGCFTPCCYCYGGGYGSGALPTALDVSDAARAESPLPNVPVQPQVVARY